MAIFNQWPGIILKASPFPRRLATLPWKCVIALSWDGYWEVIQDVGHMAIGKGFFLGKYGTMMTSQWMT